MKIGIVLTVLGSMWLGAGLASLGLFIEVGLEVSFVWPCTPFFNLCIAGIPIGTVLLFIGIQHIRRLLK